MKGRTYKQIEQAIKAEYDQIYAQKLKSIFIWFSEQKEKLSGAIQSVYQKVLKDEVLSAMMNDKTTSAHIDDRVKEIFNEVITEQNDLMFRKMTLQISNLQFENNQLKKKMQRLTQNSKNLEEQFVTQRMTFEQTRNNVNQELKRAKDEKYNIEVDKKSKEQQLEYYQQKLAQKEHKNYQLQTLLNNINKKMEQYKWEAEDQKSKANRLQNNLQKMCKKYQNKKKEYNQKIQEYKACINQLRMKSTKFQQNFRSLQEAADSGKMTKMIRDHQSKLADLKKSSDKQKSQLQRKYQYKLKESQNYFQKMLQNKIKEIQENTTSYYQKMRQEGLQFQRKIQIYQDNYINQAEFDQKVAQYIQALTIMERKLQKFQSQNQDIFEENDYLTKRLKQAERLCSQHHRKSEELQQLNKQLTTKYKEFQEKNSLFKIQQNKVQQQFQQYKKEIKKAREENEDLKKKCFNLEDVKNNFDNIIREKDRRIKQYIEENQSLTKNSKKNLSTIESLNQSNETLAKSIDQLKKHVQDLQFKISDQERTSTRVSAELEAKLINSQKEASNKGSLLTELQSKYQEMSLLYKDEKSKNYDIQKCNTGLEMECKVYKQSVEIHQHQYQLVVKQKQKVIEENNQRINQLQKQIAKINSQLKEQSQQKVAIREQLTYKNRQLTNKIKFIVRIMTQKMEDLRKDSKNIKDHLKSRLPIIRNDQAIYLSTFHKQLVYYNNLLDHQKEAVIKKVREEQLQHYNNEAKLIKNEYEERTSSLLQKQEVQKNMLKQQIKQKQERLQDSSREIKRWQLQLKKQKEQTRNVEKQLSLLTSRHQQEKQRNDYKLKQVVKEMKDEKDSILKEYSDRKNELEEQIVQLANTITQLKAQINLIVAKHEQEKLVISDQLRTVKDQQIQIQKVVYQKDQEILKCKDHSKKIEEDNKALQNQIKSYSDTLNRKIQLIHDLELSQNKNSGEFSIIKNKWERTSEQNSQLKRKLKNKDEENEQLTKKNEKLSAQLRNVSSALNKSSKTQQLKSLNQLTAQTFQLTNRVSQMKKINNLLENRTPLRS